jgi:flagella basal body P-ring formation protein FlgA
MKRTCLILLLSGLAQAQAEAPPPAATPTVRIYLPRELQAQAGYLELGDICVIRCPDDAVLHKAQTTAIGRGPFSREKLVLGRAMILARLGTAGVNTRDVEFSGAETVTLTRKEQGVATEQLVEAAEAFLIAHRPAPEGRLWRLARRPAEIMVSGQGELKLVARLPKQVAKDEDRLKLEIAVLRNQKELTVAELDYQAVYVTRRATALKDLPANTVLTSEHFQVETVTSPTRPSGPWVSPLGRMTTQAVASGKVIAPELLKAPKLEVVVRRDQSVRMQIGGVGFVINGIGKAMENGRPGDVIKVMNVDSERVVACKVAPDGTVNPVYDEETK